MVGNTKENLFQHCHVFSLIDFVATISILKVIFASESIIASESIVTFLSKRALEKMRHMIRKNLRQIVINNNKIIEL